ncbi:MAG: ATP-binding cassette domain-containing protein [Defluviitaleaceae bacterium]|nr:ATP-binding cassette domain-containing protein [Defluviitaleaceae bacterium]
MTEQKPLVEVRNLQKWFSVSNHFFSIKQNYVKAVNGVSFKVNKGETLGVVGESGSGKTTLGRAILRLTEPTGGEVLLEGQDFLKFNKRELRKNRDSLSCIFQDPQASLNPRLTVGDLIADPMRIQKKPSTKRERYEKVLELLDVVGLNRDVMWRYPHEFSGGQRQRIGIARALALSPKLVICDEPVSALDVSLQSQVLNLMDDIQKSMGVTYIFISHDLSVVKYVSDNIAVMYLGKIVEIAPKEKLYDNPIHPYTEALLSAIPIPDTKVKRTKIILQGDIPNPMNIPSGCCFRTRCQEAQYICADTVPEMKEYSPGHFYACHLR